MRQILPDLVTIEPLLVGFAPDFAIFRHCPPPDALSLVHLHRRGSSGHFHRSILTGGLTRGVNRQPRILPAARRLGETNHS
jgi:hypothetical protein